jgi:uncharacterized protein involved in exopolysaccharide biosynthesis
LSKRQQQHRRGTVELATADVEHAPAESFPRTGTPDAGENFARVLRTHWKAAAATVAAITLIAAAIAGILPRRYRATAVGAVTPLSATLTPSETFRGVEVLDRRSIVATVAALPTTAVLQREAVPAGEAPQGYAFAAEVLPNTNLVRVDVESTNAKRAADVANRMLALISRETTRMFRFYNVAPVAIAAPPSAPFAPRVGRTIIAGLVAGIIFGAAVAYALDKFSTKPSY